MTEIVTTTNSVTVVSADSAKDSVVVAESSTLVTQNDSLESVVSSTNNNVLVEESPKEHIVVQAGLQGPQGPPGDSINYIQIVTGMILSGHRAVVPDSNGLAIYADNTNMAHAEKILGVVTNSYPASTSAEVQITGQLEEPSWNWTLDLPIYVGTNGMLTQTVPEDGFLYVMGFPITPTKMFIQKQQPIILF